MLRRGTVDLHAAQVVELVHIALLKVTTATFPLTLGHMLWYRDDLELEPVAGNGRRMYLRLVNVSRDYSSPAFSSLLTDVRRLLYS